MIRRLGRRRFMAITAAAAALGAVPLGRRAHAGAATVSWIGSAMGASASLRIHHPDRGAAERLVRQAVTEIARLEGIFSLYLEDSVLCGLNQLGAVAAPPSDLIAVLEESRNAWENSGGAFDPTVQPLWSLLARHFGQPAADPSGPPPERMSEALAGVGFERVVFNRDRVVLGGRGMALTLNGVAQGYVADRITELLRSGGIGSCLVDMGEIRSLGKRPDGRPWRVGIAQAEGEGLVARLDLEDRAVATSSPAGFRFEASGRFNHLLDPRSGLGAHRYDGVTVIAARAATADAFSTAFSLLEPAAVEAVLRRVPGLDVHLLPVGASSSIRLLSEA